jgi:hypothetical protein
MGIGWWRDRNALKRAAKSDLAEKEAMIAEAQSIINSQNSLIEENNKVVLRAEMKIDSLNARIALREEGREKRRENVRREKTHLDTVDASGLVHFFNVNLLDSTDRND